MYNRSPYNRTPYNRNRAPNRTKSRPITLALVLEAQPARVIRLQSRTMGMRFSMDMVDMARIKSFQSMDVALGLVLAPCNFARVRDFCSVLCIEMALEAARQHTVTHPVSEGMSIAFDLLPAQMRMVAAVAAEFPLELEMEGYASVVWNVASKDILLHLDFDAQDAVYMTQAAELDVTIKPGQTLIIDSYPRRYTAYLDGVNVLEQYRGDWIMIDPNSIMAQLSFDGAGTAFIQIEYQERWI